MTAWPQKLEIILPGDDTWLPALRTFLASLLGNLPGDPVSRKTADELELVLQEACVNAIRHSGEGGSYQVDFIFAPDELTIEVKDGGKGFDPASVPDPVASDLPMNGYGVFIMKQSMDRVEVRREAEQFVLSMSKTLDGSGAEAERGAR